MSEVVKKQKLSSTPLSIHILENYHQQLNRRIVTTLNPESKAESDALTANGANTYSTSKSAIVDLFFALARGCTKDRVRDLMDAAWFESPLETCLLLLQARDCRDGKGERLVVYFAMLWLREKKPLVYQQLLPLCVQVGSFADLRKLAQMAHMEAKKSKSFGTHQEFEMQLLAHVLKDDRLKLNQPEGVSLAAKWAPSEHKAGDRRAHLASVLAHQLVAGEPAWNNAKHSEIMHHYRDLLTRLRERIGSVEILLASKRFKEIDYNAQTSRGHHVYKKAFFRNDTERYKEYLSSLKKQQEENKNKPEQEQKKELKINVATLFPHEIIRDYIHENGFSIAAEVNDLRQTQWNATLERYKNMQGAFNEAVSLVDVSGSMLHGGDTSITPIEVSVALGLLTASLCTRGKFAHRIITFHENPTWYTIDPNEHIKDQVKNLMAAPWGGSTNFELALQLILNDAQTTDDVPKLLIVYSDMQFNQANRGPSGFSSTRDNTSLFHHIQAQYEAKGLKMPRIVFWNLNSAICLDLPVQKDESGVCLLSGFSPVIMKVLLERGIDDVAMNPKNVVLAAIEPYNTILTEALKNNLL
jgi:Mg-chelatase subunit ChlD